MRFLRFLLQLLLLIGVVILFLSTCAVFMVSGDTKLAGVVFIGSGLYGLLGFQRGSAYREKPFHMVIGSVGAIGLGIYLLLR